MDKEYKNELNSLERERILKTEIVETYKNKIINEILNSNELIDTQTIIKPKKTFWEKVVSIF